MKTIWNVFDGIGINIGLFAINLKKPTEELIAEWSRKANEHKGALNGVFFVVA
jgi:hypothetical protein